jgi:hypothetical protein
MLWAVPAGAAHNHVRAISLAAANSKIRIPATIRFREVRARGLLVNAWISGSGPYVFAIDTGAGISIVSQNVVYRAAIPLNSSHQIILGGLSASPIVSDQEATISQLSLGTIDNAVPGRFVAAVAPLLPSGIDGILDPTEAFNPLGYSIDLPNRELQAFDSKAHRLHVTDSLVGGTVVQWIRERGSHRPFVRMGDGRLALLDTGSGFGLAINETGAVAGMNHGKQGRGVHDLGGGTVESRRVAPATVSIGDLVLRSVPTDILTGAASDTPVILGRDALYPFRITFDPTAQLIAIEPAPGK